jgi:hypothetical protein
MQLWPSDLLYDLTFQIVTFHVVTFHIVTIHTDENPLVSQPTGAAAGVSLTTAVIDCTDRELDHSATTINTIANDSISQGYVHSYVHL